MTPAESRAGEHARTLTHKAWLAARLLEETLGDDAMPPYVPGEPQGMAAFAAAQRAVPRLLEGLAQIYGRPLEGYTDFMQAYVDGAIAAWKPDTRVLEGPDEVRIESGVCPVRERATRDPRLCGLCRLIHTAVARRTMPGEVNDVVFERLATAGDAGCAVVIRRNMPGR